MDKKVISIDEIKKEKFNEDFPEIFTLEDAIKFSNMIEYYLNSFYYLALEDEKYHSVCTTEQINLLTSIYSSFFKILFSEMEEFDYSEKSNSIMFKFISELYKICSNLTNVDTVKENIDKKVLSFEKEEEN